MAANELRGEVDLELEGERFVLRPSYTAIVAAEKATGRGLVKLAEDAGEGALTLTECAAITALFIRAWGEATGNTTAAHVNEGRVGELIMDFGLAQVQLRLQIALTLAATGGCRADGTLKGEAKAAGTETSATPVESSPA